MGSRRTLLAIAAAATALAVVTAGCSGGGSKGKAPSGGSSATSPGGTSPDKVASAFLAAWQAGDYDKAASYTDDAAKAAPRLKSVMDLARAEVGVAEPGPGQHGHAVAALQRRVRGDPRGRRDPRGRGDLGVRSLDALQLRRRRHLRRQR